MGRAWRGDKRRGAGSGSQADPRACSPDSLGPHIANGASTGGPLSPNFGCHSDASFLQKRWGIVSNVMLDTDQRPLVRRGVKAQRSMAMIDSTKTVPTDFRHLNPPSKNDIRGVSLFKRNVPRALWPSIEHLPPVREAPLRSSDSSRARAGRRRVGSRDVHLT